MWKITDIFSLKTVKTLFLAGLMVSFLGIGQTFAAACGSFENGCPEGKVCVKTTKKVSWGRGDYTEQTIYNCVNASDANPKDTVESGTNNHGTGLAESKDFAPKSDIDECPLVTDVRDKYTSGCWSCLVVEKLTTAFLTAAEKAYELSQRAGLTLLFIGAIMWIMMWGLKNMSSLTQLEPGNLLNDLLKFGFKVMVAYIFITSGLKVVREFIISPLMGTGAVIAQQFWPEPIREAIEEYNWEDNVDTGGLTAQQSAAAEIRHAQNVEEYKKSQQTQLQEVSKVNNATMSEEERQKNIEALNDSARKVSISGVPQFIIYPTSGTLVSEFGKRNYSGCRLHAGIDISTPVGSAVMASFDGTVTRVGWQDASNPKKGYGMRIYVRHVGGWETVYAHLSAFKVKQGDVVRKGNVIGLSGNSGSSGGPHLHFEIHTPQGRPVDPIGIADGEVNEVDYVGTRNECNNPYGKDSKRGAVGPNMTPIPLSGDYLYGSEAKATSGSSGSRSSIAVGNSAYSAGDLVVHIDDVNYTGPTNIMPASIMNSILGAVKVITDTTSETMVLGDAIQCYAGNPKGGAWNISVLGFRVSTMTNFWMWIEGALIWCVGFLLTMAVAYYLVDISFKLGFAVIALPIVVGLWPFNMTKGKFSNCLSIIFKASATFAFLAITSYYSIQLISEALGDLEKLYKAFDTAAGGTYNQEQVDMVSNQLQIFSINFIILLFAFMYSIKLIQATIPDFVNKFFPDNMFGNAQPMHHWATAATRWVKDQAMKPVGYARDVTMYQGGKLVKGGLSRLVGMVRSRKAGGSGGGGAASTAAKGAQAAAKAGEYAGEGIKQVGKGIGAVSKAANAIPVVGQAVSIAGGAVGKAVEAGGEAVKQTSKAAGKVAEQAQKAAEKVEKAAEKVSSAGSDSKKDAGGEAKPKGDDNLLG